MNGSRLTAAFSRLHLVGPCHVVILPLPGQVPGQYYPEHDVRMQATLDAWAYCHDLGHKAEILLTSGPADTAGLTVARYMEQQIIHFAEQRRYRRSSLTIRIGEERSCSTAQQIRFTRGQLLGVEPLADNSRLEKVDLVVLVSNGPHLWPAGSYFRHLNPELPFVKWSSGNGDGCIGMGLWPFRVRELKHYVATMTIDRDGCRFDHVTDGYRQKWMKLRLPPVPYRPEPYFIQLPGT